MVDQVTALQNVRDRFQTLVTDTESLPTYYDNAPGPSHALVLHAAVWVTIDTSECISVGPPAQFRHEGHMMVAIWQPITTGTKPTEDLVQVITPLFRGSTVAGVRYQFPRLTVLRRKVDNVWWQTNLFCPFRTEEYES